MPRFDVVAIGEINADLVLSGDTRPVFGQVEKIVDGARLTIGSSACIFACGAARLGLRTAIVGKVGTDTFGRFMTDALDRSGVEVSGLVVDPDLPTGLSVILSAGADRAILTYKGCISALTHGDIPSALLESTRHVHLASYYLLDALRPDVPKLFDAAHAAGASVSIDTNYDPSETWGGGVAEALDRADIFLPNAAEAAGLTGATLPTVALARLVERTPVVAMKLGAEGAMASRRGGAAVEVKAPPVAVIDTVGAGDSFDAGFVYGGLKGWDLTQTLRFAVACGSLSTRREGGTDGQAEAAEALALMARDG